MSVYYSYTIDLFFFKWKSPLIDTYDYDTVRRLENFGEMMASARPKILDNLDRRRQLPQIDWIIRRFRFVFNITFRINKIKYFIPRNIPNSLHWNVK